MKRYRVKAKNSGAGYFNGKDISIQMGHEYEFDEDVVNALSGSLEVIEEIVEGVAPLESNTGGNDEGTETAVKSQKTEKATRKVKQK